MPKLQHTTIEELRRARTLCPIKGCGGYVAEIVLLGRYEYKECNDCGHRYDLRNSKGQSVTKEEWDQLRQKSMERLAGGEAEERRAQARHREQWKQEVQEMKKSKKAAKGAKDAGKKKAKKAAKPTASKALASEERAKSSPLSFCAFLIYTTSQDNAAIQKQVLTKFPNAVTGYKNGSYVRGIRTAIENGSVRYAWLKTIKSAKAKKS